MCSQENPEPTADWGKFASLEEELMQSWSQQGKLDREYSQYEYLISIKINCSALYLLAWCFFALPSQGLRPNHPHIRAKRATRSGPKVLTSKRTENREGREGTAHVQNHFL